MTFTIALSDEKARRLEELAREGGVAPEELLRASVEDWLAEPREDFARAASYVLQKSKELYRRLA
ncbi:MAG TPA: CopG family transcriptional regulator [Thermoanaerobaculia bacterium]|nr:CopG family transcriptional regulator [Thermoanaerobaculia bacterium]